VKALIISNYFPPSEIGGAEISAFYSAQGLATHGVRFHVLMTNARAPADESCEYWYQDILVSRRCYRYLGRNAWRELFDQRVYQSTLAVLRRFRPDIVHAHNITGASLAPLLACRRVGVPIVQTLHDLWALCPNNMMYRRDRSRCTIAPGQCRNCSACARHLEWWADLPARRVVFRLLLLRLVRVFIAPSHCYRDLHIQAGYPAARVMALPYGLPLDPPAPLSEPAAIRALHSDTHAFTLLMAGSFMEHKGADSVLAALRWLTREDAQADQRLRAWRWIIAGYIAPEYRQALAEFPNVIQLPWVPFNQMRTLFAYADIVVQPSIWQENQPLSILESFMAGTPVIGAQAGGIPELIQDGQTGFLFRAGDGEHLAEKIRAAMSLPGDRFRAMRRACRAHAQRNWSLETHAQRLYEVYQQACSR